MNQGIKGTEIFWAGWMMAVVTFYLGGLDTGQWLPLAFNGVEIVALVMMLAGVRSLYQTHKNYKAATIIVAVALIVSFGTGGLLILATGGITSWMAIAALCLAVTGDTLFVVTTGLVLLGNCAMIRQDGNEKAANRLGYLWALFLTFGILYMLIQAAAILLVNENLEALTYVVPATGVPMLIVSLLIILNLYRSHSPLASPQMLQEK
jgi:uncharacterized membrane protein